LTLIAAGLFGGVFKEIVTSEEKKSEIFGFLTSKIVLKLAGIRS